MGEVLLVTTQGSKHMFDLEKGTWIRMQLDGLNAMEHDDKEVQIIDWVRQPVEGGTFELYWDDNGRPVWHRSSTIREIRSMHA